MTFSGEGEQKKWPFLEVLGTFEVARGDGREWGLKVENREETDGDGGNNKFITYTVLLGQDTNKKCCF